MNFPKHIGSFLLYNLNKDFKFKGKNFFTAHYIKVGTKVDLHINTISDKNGNQEYEIKIKGSKVTGIKSIEDALTVVENIIEENDQFVK